MQYGQLVMDPVNSGNFMHSDPWSGSAEEISEQITNESSWERKFRKLSETIVMGTDCRAWSGLRRLTSTMKRIFGFVAEDRQCGAVRGAVWVRCRR